MQSSGSHPVAQLPNQVVCKEIHFKMMILINSDHLGSPSPVLPLSGLTFQDQFMSITLMDSVSSLPGQTPTVSTDSIPQCHH